MQNKQNSQYPNPQMSREPSRQEEVTMDRISKIRSYQSANSNFSEIPYFQNQLSKKNSRTNLYDNAQQNSTLQNGYYQSQQTFGYTPSLGQEYSFGHQQLRPYPEPPMQIIGTPAQLVQFCREIGMQTMQQPSYPAQTPQIASSAPQSPYVPTTASTQNCTSQQTQQQQSLPINQQQEPLFSSRKNQEVEDVINESSEELQEPDTPQLLHVEKQSSKNSGHQTQTAHQSTYSINSYMQNFTTPPPALALGQTQSMKPQPNAQLQSPRNMNIRRNLQKQKSNKHSPYVKSGFEQDYIQIRDEYQYSKMNSQNVQSEDIEEQSEESKREQQKEKANQLSNAIMQLNCQNDEEESENSSITKEILIPNRGTSEYNQITERTKGSQQANVSEDKISKFVLRNIQELVRFLTFEEKPIDTLLKEALEEFEFQMSQNEELSEEERDALDQKQEYTDMISMISQFKKKVICKTCQQLKSIDPELIHSKKNGHCCQIGDQYCRECLIDQRKALNVLFAMMCSDRMMNWFYI